MDRRGFSFESADGLVADTAGRRWTRLGDASTRQADLVQLEQIAGGYPSRERFLTELTLNPPDAPVTRPVCRISTRTT